MTADGDKEIEAKRKSGDIVKCVVVRCYETKCIFGHVIPCKGPGEDGFTVNLITGDIGRMGHTKVIGEVPGCASLPRSPDAEGPGHGPRERHCGALAGL